MFTYIYHKKSTKSIGKYIIHGSYGHAEARFVGWVISRTRTPGIPNSNLCHPRIGLLLWSFSSKRGVIWRWKTNSEFDEFECFIMEVFLSNICKLLQFFLVETNYGVVSSVFLSNFYPQNIGKNDPAHCNVQATWVWRYQDIPWHPPMVWPHHAAYSQCIIKKITLDSCCSCLYVFWYFLNKKHHWSVRTKHFLNKKQYYTFLNLQITCQCICSHSHLHFVSGLDSHRHPKFHPLDLLVAGTSSRCDQFQWGKWWVFVDSVDVELMALMGWLVRCGLGVGIFKGSRDLEQITWEGENSLETKNIPSILWCHFALFLNSKFKFHFNLVSTLWIQGSAAKNAWKGYNLGGRVSS